MARQTCINIYLMFMLSFNSKPIEINKDQAVRTHILVLKVIYNQRVGKALTVSIN